jgi:hypothetical protein
MHVLCNTIGNLCGSHVTFPVFGMSLLLKFLSIIIIIIVIVIVIIPCVRLVGQLQVGTVDGSLNIIENG